MMYSYRDLFNVKRECEQELLRKKNVCGVGIGYKMSGGRIMSVRELSIVALVTQKVRPLSLLSSHDAVPSTIEGITTDILETGVIRVPPTPVTPLRQTPIRPAPGGCSIGYYRITAGTLGCLVRRGYETFILSNNHVLADENKGQRGDPILQPGPYDGAMFPEHKIAELEDFVPLTFTGTNKVDAAIAKPVSLGIVTDEILGIGIPRGTIRADLGIRVIKSGRTTGITRGVITIMDATVDIEYKGGRARFENQLIVAMPGFSRGGDSGSVVLIDDGTRRVCGLLFAGSEYVTIINRIEDVLSALNITL